MVLTDLVLQGFDMQEQIKVHLEYLPVKEVKVGHCEGCIAECDIKLCQRLATYGCVDRIWRLSKYEQKVPEQSTPENQKVSTPDQLPGTKYDDGKLDYTLVPSHGLAEVARNLTEGLKKYRERDNWKKVPEAQERYLKALYRHLEAHRRGEIYDTESSAEDMPHMAAVAVNALFLLEFMLDPNLKDKS